MSSKTLERIVLDGEIKAVFYLCLEPSILLMLTNLSLTELEKELSRRPKKVCIVKVVGTRNLWKNIVVLCVNS